MDRQNFYFGKLVDVPEMSDLQNNIENGINVIKTILGKGIWRGGAISISQNLNLSIDDTVCFDNVGNTIFIGNQVFNMAGFIPPTDKKIVSITASFSRNYSQPEQDDQGNNVFFKEDEGCLIEYIESDISTSPIAPTIPESRVLLVDVTLAAGQTQINAGDLNLVRVKKLDSLEKKLIDVFRYIDSQIANHDSQHDDRFYQKSEVDTKDALRLEKSQNLNDLSNKATARTNLDVYNKTEVLDEIYDSCSDAVSTANSYSDSTKIAKTTNVQAINETEIEDGMLVVFDRTNKCLKQLGRARLSSSGAYLTLEESVGASGVGIEFYSPQLNRSAGITYEQGEVRIYEHGDLVAQFSNGKIKINSNELQTVLEFFNDYGNEISWQFTVDHSGNGKKLSIMGPTGELVASFYDEGFISLPYSHGLNPHVLADLATYRSLDVKHLHSAYIIAAHATYRKFYEYSITQIGYVVTVSCSGTVNLSSIDNIEIIIPVHWEDEEGIDATFIGTARGSYSECYVQHLGITGDNLLTFELADGANGSVDFSFMLRFTLPY